MLCMIPFLYQFIGVFCILTPSDRRLVVRSSGARQT